MEVIQKLEGPNHVSDSIEKAESDFTTLFPDFNVPKVSISAQLREAPEDDSSEQTLTIITPHAAAKYTSDIINDIESKLKT